MLMKLTQIKTRAKSIGTKQGKLNEEIHVLLCHSTMHALEHGDITGTTAIFKAVRGADRGAMTKWIHTYGLGQINKDGEFVVNKTARNKAAFTLEDLLQGETWYSMTPTEQDIAKEWDSEKFAAHLKKYLAKQEAIASEQDEELARVISKASSEFIRQLEMLEIKELIAQD